MSSFKFTTCPYCPADRGHVEFHLSDELSASLMGGKGKTSQLTQRQIELYISIGQRSFGGRQCAHSILLVGNVHLRDGGELAFAWTHEGVQAGNSAGTLQDYLWSLLDGDVPDEFLPTDEFRWLEFDLNLSEGERHAAHTSVASCEGYALFAEDPAELLSDARHLAIDFFHYPY